MWLKIGPRKIAGFLWDSLLNHPKKGTLKRHAHLSMGQFPQKGTAGSGQRSSNIKSRHNSRSRSFRQVQFGERQASMTGSLPVRWRRVSFGKGNVPVYVRSASYQQVAQVHGWVFAHVFNLGDQVSTQAIPDRTKKAPV